MARDRLTSPALMNLAAADLSTVIFLSAGGISAVLILSKYCFTRVSSMKTGCSRALTPLSRRYARDCIRQYYRFQTHHLQNSIDSIAYVTRT